MAEQMTVELFRKLVDRLPGAISLGRLNMATGQLDSLYISANGPAVYGMTMEEMHVDTSAWLKRVPPEDAARLQEEFAAALQKGTPLVWTGRIAHPDGETHWIEIRSSHEIQADGTIITFGQTLDVTERKRTEDALVKSEQERRASDLLHRAVIEALPVGVIVQDGDSSYPIYNAAQRQLSGAYDAEGQKLKGDDLMQRYGFFLADGVTPLAMSEAPITRAFAGEEIDDVEIVVRSPLIEGERRMLTQARSIRDESGKVVAAVGVSVDLTSQRALEKELLQRNEQLAKSEEAKTGLVERLRLAVDELSNPILEVWDDVLAMPVIGLVDSRRTADMVRRLLAEVARTQATFVIVDLTGVEIVDTKTADHLIKLMRKVEIVGARCVLTGVRPAIAETLVDIGVDFARLPTLRNLKHGLREALRHAKREREGLRDVLIDDDSSAKGAVAPTRSTNGER